jgi:outer membrane protein assembly factor BamE (lipoprotein component of BamABCDE complex)
MQESACWPLHRDIAMTRIFVLASVLAAGVAILVFQVTKARHDSVTRQSETRPRGHIDMQTAQLIIGGMSKNEVRKLAGLPVRSTDTEWYYLSEPNSLVEVKFSTRGRVIQITTLRQPSPAL